MVLCIQGNIILQFTLFKVSVISKNTLLFFFNIFFFMMMKAWWYSHCLICVMFYLFIYLFMAVLGLRFCARAFSSCGKRGPLFIAVRRPLTIVASPVEEHRLQMRRLSNCGSRAQLLRGMWGPPRPGPEPMSPASAGRLSTTAPPGKPYLALLKFLLNESRMDWCAASWQENRLGDTIWVFWCFVCLFCI